MLGWEDLQCELLTVGDEGFQAVALALRRETGDFCGETQACARSKRGTAHLCQVLLLRGGNCERHLAPWGCMTSFLLQLRSWVCVEFTGETEA